LANPDTARVLRPFPRHDSGKTEQAKKGDFALHGVKWFPNSSDFALYRPHHPKKGVWIMPRVASGKSAICLTYTRLGTVFRYDLKLGMIA
jgi:hypothetical protein